MESIPAEPNFKKTHMDSGILSNPRGTLMPNIHIGEGIEFVSEKLKNCQYGELEIATFDVSQSEDVPTDIRYRSKCEL
jgi:hypothetical protein